MSWTLNMHHWSNFDAFLPVKNQQNVKFLLKLWFFRNCLMQRLETCGIGFGMHTFWVIMVFCMFMVRSRYRILKHGVGVKWDPSRIATYGHPIFMVLNPIFCDVSPEIVLFHEPFIVETCNKCHYQHDLNPKYAPLKQFWCIFASQKSTKCEIIAWNCDFSGTAYCRDLKPAALESACLEP